MTGQDDDLGSVLGTRTCPWGILLQNITVEYVTLVSTACFPQLPSRAFGSQAVISFYFGI